MAKNKKEINPLWGGRFKSGTDDLAQSFSASIDIDKRLFEVDIQGSIAYAEILNVANLINSSELKKIKKGLNKVLDCLLYTSPSPRDVEESRMPSSA